MVWPQADVFQIIELFLKHDTVSCLQVSFKKTWLIVKYVHVLQIYHMAMVPSWEKGYPKNWPGWLKEDFFKSFGGNIFYMFTVSSDV